MNQLERIGDCERCGHAGLAHSDAGCCGADGDCGCPALVFFEPSPYASGADEPIALVPTPAASVPVVHGVPLTDEVLDALDVLEAAEVLLEARGRTLADLRADVRALRSCA